MVVWIWIHLLASDWLMNKRKWIYYLSRLESAKRLCISFNCDKWKFYWHRITKCNCIVNARTLYSECCFSQNRIEWLVVEMLGDFILDDSMNCVRWMPASTEVDTIWNFWVGKWHVEREYLCDCSSVTLRHSLPYLSVQVSCKSSFSANRVFCLLSCHSKMYSPQSFIVIRFNAIWKWKIAVRALGVQVNHIRNEIPRKEVTSSIKIWLDIPIEASNVQRNNA